MNNAGVMDAVPGAVDVKCEGLVDMFSVNVLGTHRVTQAFYPLLLTAVQQQHNNNNNTTTTTAQKEDDHTPVCVNVSSELGSILNCKDTIRHTCMWLPWLPR